MQEYTIYRDIAARTAGNIYIGVVGPVRTGKSSFIKRFMDVLVLPEITEENTKRQIMDELPQSGSGRTDRTAPCKRRTENRTDISGRP